ncbi:MAG: hypothetical protein ACYSWX_10455 [Planctomycetota bacterium]
MTTDDDFYVGYLERMPTSVGTRVRRTIVLIAALAVLTATALAVRQRATGDGTYEFGIDRPFAGHVELVPYPTLRVPRPGADAGYSRYPVVAFAKFGAHEALAPHQGEWVELRAALVHRDSVTMLELVDGSVTPTTPPATLPAEPEAAPRRPIEVEGEIVDSKCFLGAMKPGLGRSHKACAELCVRGGIPPLMVGLQIDGERSGEFVKALLVGPGGTTLNAAVLPLIAESVRVRGELEERDGLHLLHTDPGRIERL